MYDENVKMRHKRHEKVIKRLNKCNEVLKNGQKL